MDIKIEVIRPKGTLTIISYDSDDPDCFELTMEFLREQIKRFAKGFASVPYESRAAGAIIFEDLTIRFTKRKEQH